MKFSNLVSSVASDGLILQSVGDYYQSLNEKSLQMADDLSYVISKHGDADYTRPEFNYSIVYQKDDVPVTVNVGQFLTAVEEDADEFVDSTTGVVISVNDLVDQISQSITANRIIISTIRTLTNSAAESISNITASFWANLQLTVGSLSETASNLASDLLGLITQTGKGVGDRVRDILEYVGIYSISQDSQPDIGLPETRIHEVSGVNAWNAWFNSVPSNIFEFGEWLKQAVTGIINLVKNVTEIVLGSSTYRAIQKFINTLTLQADSFSITAGEAENMSIGNMGFSWIVGDLSMPEVIPGSGFNKIDTVNDILKVLLAWTNPMEPDTPIAVDDDIRAKLRLLSSFVNLAVNEDYLIPYDQTLERIHYSKLPRIPNWAQTLNINFGGEMTDIPDDLYSYTVYCYVNLVGRYYNDLPSKQPSIFEMLQYTVGIYLDDNHINDVSGLTNHLETKSYVQIDLPGSSLFLWLVGSQVVCTRRVTPLSYFMDWSVYDISTYFMSMFHGDKIAIGNPGIVDPKDDCVSWMKYTIGALLADCRNLSQNAINSDEQMIKSCFASNLADAVYLMALDAMEYNDLSLNDDIIGPGLIRLRPGFVSAGGMLKYFWFLRFLTGYDYESLANIASKNSVDLTNIDLARMLGADLGYVSFDGDDIVDGVYYKKALLVPITYLISFFDNDDVFVPFCHVTHIPSGAYGVMLDSDLVNVVSRFLTFVAVVAATVYVVKKIRSLKKKALAMSTRADATAWAMIEAGSYDQQAINNQYKMRRRADLCEKLSQGIFGSVTKVISSIGGATTSAASAFTSKIKTLISGSNGDESLSSVKNDINNDIDGLETEISNIRTLISG